MMITQKMLLSNVTSTKITMSFMKNYLYLYFPTVRRLVTLFDAFLNV